jgi:16S rRNA (uracil1498-N3)-methyltransferase
MFKIGIVIGPEGGFTDAEIAEARAAGARTVTLGPNILRTETAGIVAAALALAAISEPEFQH